MNEQLTKDTFARHLKTKFQLYYAPEKSVEIELIEMSGDELQKVKGMERFTLVFHVPIQQMLPQGIYPMEHAEMGKFEIFIVPTGHAEPGFRYEAVFNRAVEEEAAAS